MIRYVYETSGILTVVIISVLTGIWISRLGGIKWLAGFFIPLIMLFLIAFARRTNLSYTTPALSWIVKGRNEYVLLSIVIPMLMTVLIAKVPGKRPRFLLILLLAISSLHYAVFPFLWPAFVYNKQKSIETKFDKFGVCIQQTGYNCGPAAAVTLLRQYNIPADQGQIAIEAYTNPITGTPDDLLCEAMNKLYGNNKLQFETVLFESIKDLQSRCPAIVSIKYGPLVDHYVVVLKTRDDLLAIGDPAAGFTTYSKEEFREKWRSTGIVARIKLESAK